MDIAAHINQQARRVDRRPTEPQKEAGNYRKGHVKIHGLDISIENPRGSWRSGTDTKTGKPWRAQLPHHYGDIKRTVGGDSDNVDCFIGPHLKSPHVFVIDQHRLTGGKAFDEHKCFIGFGSEKQASSAYQRAFSDGRGKDRIGHIETMTVDDFKDWLRNGDTASPVKHRAGGGRVHMADGGVPAFDQTQPVDTSPPPFEATQPVATDSGVLHSLGLSGTDGPDQGMLHALGHGAAAGATFNFSDELAGVNAAAPKIPGTNMDIPDMLGPVPARMMAGAARLAKGYLMGNDPEASDAYTKARDEERQAQQSAKSHHPYVYGAGEVAGSIPAMAALPELGVARGAGLGADIARGVVAGGQYGALSGAGEGDDATSRALNAGTGGLGGVAGGVIAPVAGKVLSAGYNKFVQPAVEAYRGWQDPAGEAARRVASALQKDSQMIADGTAKGMSPSDWIAARNAGEPVTLADLGAGNTQALLRSAANTSPEGRAMLEKVIEDRFLGQSERVAGDVRGLVAGGANANKTAEDLVADYDRARKPAYQRAYQEGDREIMTPEMERLMGSPTVVAAMHRAETSGKDRAITEGLGAFNPGVTVENGVVKFNKGPTGVPTYPNLQYWDAVKKELDSAATQARRSGDTSSVAGNLATTLRNELDNEVPSYANARGIASQFFGENNALEAGRNLAGKRVDPQVIQSVMGKMKPDERDLFREGYASDWANRVISNISDTRDITKAMFNSPNERARALAVFGPAGMAKIQARMTLETIMDGARKAMGNSTTARQLIEAGLAGGALSGYASGWDPVKMAEGAGAGAGARVAAAKYLGSEIGAGARNLIGKVDATTARNVARLLTSNDPSDLAQGLRMATKNQKIADGLKNIANRVSMGSIVPSTSSVASSITPALRGYRGPNLGPLQGPVPASANQEQPQPPRGIQQ